MGGSRSIEISALNVTLHPHSPELYLKLFEDVYRQRRVAQYRRNNYALIGSMTFLSQDDRKRGVRGEIFRFVDFDKSSKWLNLQLRKVAEPAEMYAVSLPSHLKPEFATSRYAFFPKQHVLIFETKTEDNRHFSPHAVEAAFQKLFADDEIEKRMGDVSVTLIPDSESLTRIFEIPELQRLVIRLKRPNPDDLDLIEEEVRERLVRQQAQFMEERLHARRGKTLKPDKRTKKLAKVAQSNGFVEGNGRDAEGRRVVESTRKHPWRKELRFDPKTSETSHVFGLAAEEAAEYLVRAKRTTEGS